MPSPTKNRSGNSSTSLEAKVSSTLAALPGPIALVGFGVEGRGTLEFLRAQQAEDLRVFDHGLDAAGVEALAGEFSGVTFRGGEDWCKPVTECGTVFRSPGVRPDLPVIEAAREAGAAVTSATELFLALCPGRVAGVTGTVGKGTAASLIGEALNAGGPPCHLGGNIGINPLAFLMHMRADDVAVLELSSFQLMGLQGRRPEVAVILRTSSEHLDWHRDVQEYLQAKAQLLAAEDAPQTVIHCADSEGSRAIVSACNGQRLEVSLRGAVNDGVGVEDGRVKRFRGGAGQPLPKLENLSMPGRFNLENAAAAWLAAEALEAAAAPALSAIAAFPGLPHRLEHVGNAGGVRCYNDSYATRPDATLAALREFREPLSIIMGGSEKFADFGALCEAVSAHTSLRRVVLIGSTAERLAGELDAAAKRIGRAAPSIFRAESLETAYQAGLKALDGSGVLLFSPGCASFDMFPNYKVRGERFRALVEAREDQA